MDTAKTKPVWLESRLSEIYVIAEVGINHNGDMATAKKLIRAAVEAGADAVKFQCRNLEKIYTKDVWNDSKKAEQNSQYLLSELKKAHLTFTDIENLFHYSQRFNVDCLVTPFDSDSATFLNDLGLEAFKIGSPDMTNLLLLKQVVSYGKPIIISTGMSGVDEIKQVVDFLKNNQAEFCLLHCNSTYPAFPQDLNLRMIPKMKQDYGVPVGYSGHERGFVPTLAAVAMGAQVVERHITLDRTQTGPDHNASLAPDEFKNMVIGIHEIEMSLGASTRSMGQGEKGNRLALGKSLVYKTSLAKGMVIKEECFEAKSPARGISVLKYPDFIGRNLTCDVQEDDYVSEGHFSEHEIEDYHQLFGERVKWGIIGRLNDFDKFLTLKPRVIEIHLTWRDLLEEKPKVDSTKLREQELIVHSPEYYQDKLIDFTTGDKSITAYSLDSVKRSMELAKKLAEFTKQKPMLIVHPGGHFENGRPKEVKELYSRLEENISPVMQDSGIEVLLENMPPLPWYYGGQWHQVVFMDAEEIAGFFDQTGWSMCYDTSHAQLYCAFSNQDLIAHANRLKPYIRYLHISDAAGVTEEGLQIGDGDIKFKQLLELFADQPIKFVPEIWQGHLNQGEGFKLALSRLASIMTSDNVQRVFKGPRVIFERP